MGGVDVQQPARALRSGSKRASRSPWVERMGRYGLVAEGVSYGLVGALAMAVAGLVWYGLFSPVDARSSRV